MKQDKRDEMQERIADFRNQYEQLVAEGYTAKDCIISILKANVMALVTAGPFAVLAAVLYYLKWGGNTLTLSADVTSLGMLLLALIISIPVHEGLHGLAWSLVAKNGWKSIRFGVMRPSYTPYCHCKEPLGYFEYLFGALAPFLVLGVGVFLIGYFSGRPFWVTFSMINFLAAGGDTTLALLMLPHTKALFLDHPSECGFTAFERNG